MSHGRLDVRAPLLALLALLGSAPACRPPLPEVFSDPRLGRGIRMFEDKQIESMTFSADGSLLLVELGPGAHDAHSLVRLFDTASLRLLWQVPAYAGAFDPAGTRVALLPEGEHALELREARTGVRRWRRSAAAEAYAVAFVGSRRVAVGGTRGLGFFDAVDGRRLALLPIAGHVWAIASARDGRSVALLVEQRRSAPVCGFRTEAHVLELDDGPGGPRARTHCQVSTSTTLRLSSEGDVLAVDTASAETLLIDARSCRALLRTCGLATSTANGRLWLTSAERAGTMRLVARDLNARGWRDGPAHPVAASVMALGRDEVASASRESARPHALRVHLHALHGWLRSAASGPPKPLNGVALRWDDECRERIPPRSNARAAQVAAVRLEETRFTLQLDAFGPGLALRVHNRSTKALRLEWEQRVATTDATLAASPDAQAAAVASPANETRVHNLSCDLCALTPGEPCAPTELPAGSTLVDHLTFLRGTGKPPALPTLMDPWGECGQSMILGLRLTFAGEATQTRRLRVTRPCSLVR